MYMQGVDEFVSQGVIKFDFEVSCIGKELHKKSFICI